MVIRIGAIANIIVDIFDLFMIYEWDVSSMFLFNVMCHNFDCCRRRDSGG